MYGSLAHTGVSWPIYALIGLGSVVAGGAVKALTWFKGR